MKTELTKEYKTKNIKKPKLAQTQPETIDFRLCAIDTSADTVSNATTLYTDTHIHTNGIPSGYYPRLSIYEQIAMQQRKFQKITFKC